MEEQSLPQRGHAKKFWLTEAVIIALTPFVGYLFAFTFEAGKASFFSMPWEFINIGLSQILIFVLGFWFIIACMIVFIDSLSVLLPSSVLLFTKLIPVLPGTIIFIVSLIKKDYSTAIGVFVTLCMLIAPSFVLPFFLIKDEKNYFNKLQKWENFDAEFRRNRNSFTTRLMKNLGAHNTALVFSLIFCGFIVYEAGKLIAARQTYFLIPSNNDKEVAVGLYGENAVCMTLGENKTLTPSFKIVKLSDSSFQLKKVGPFRVDSKNM